MTRSLAYAWGDVFPERNEKALPPSGNAFFRVISIGKWRGRIKKRRTRKSAVSFTESQAVEILLFAAWWEERTGTA